MVLQNVNGLFGTNNGATIFAEQSPSNTPPSISGQPLISSNLSDSQPLNTHSSSLATPDGMVRLSRDLQ